MTKPRYRQLRIAYCLDSFKVGGTELNAVKTVESLDPNRYQVSVFHLSSSGPLRSRYEKLGVPITHIPIPNLYSIETIRQGVRLSRLLRKSGIDIVHSHDIYCNIFMVPWARMLTKCAVIASRRWGRAASHPQLGAVNKLAYRFAHKTLGNSESIARLLVESDKVSPNKVIQIPNFLNEHAFSHVSADERHSQRRLWGLPVGSFVIGIVARLRPVKNHSLLLRAMASLDRRFHLVVVGDGPQRDQLRLLAEDLDITSRIRFLGEITPEKNLHQYFDVSVLCSVSEGFPNSLIEAMASGRPVVATSVGGIIDVVENGVSGVLVPTDDPEYLAKVLRKLEADSAFRQGIAEKGRAIVRTSFHESVVIPKLSNAYESLAAEYTRAGVDTATLRGES